MYTCQLSQRPTGKYSRPTLIQYTRQTHICSTDCASEKLSNIININKIDNSLLSALQVHFLSFFIIKTDYKIRLTKCTELLNDERRLVKSGDNYNVFRAACEAAS